MYKFMLSMKDPVTKGIRMHQDGEIDTRSVYTCLVVARILNMLTPGMLCILLFIPTYLPAYLPAYVHTHIHTYIL